MEPEILYVVVGEPLREGETPPYSTDPRTYGLNLFDHPVSDEEFEREHRHRVHAYQVVDDAVDAMYRCGLEPPGSFLNVYVRRDGEWVYDENETHKVIAETAW